MIQIGAKQKEENNLVSDTPPVSLSLVQTYTEN